MKEIKTGLAKSVLVHLGLTAAALAMDAAIQKKIFWSGTATLIFSNKELNDIVKIIKSLEDSGLLIKGVENENWNCSKWNKRTKMIFSGILAATLGATLLGNMTAGKGVLWAGKDQELDQVRIFNATSSFN